MTYVCITGNEQSPAVLEQRIESVLASHPRVLCELRLDFLDLSPAAAFSFLARLPAEMAPRLVLTQRLKASGPLASGRCGWDVVTWQSWWRDVMALRPWFATDLDWLVLDRLAGESLAWRGGKFRSRHSFFSLHGTLDEVEHSLPGLVASARDHSAGVKVACPVETAKDLMRLADLSERLGDIPFKTVVAMGAAGKAWRWSPLAGTLTYFAADAGRATAPGQEEMAAVLPYLSTKQRPELFLLLSDNPENRYGEERWNRAFLRRGARYRYVNNATKDPPGEAWAGNMLLWMGRSGIRGASVTKPYKLCLPEAPVNTVMMRNGLWEFTNTDGEAVRRLLFSGGVKLGERVVIAGGGGAARATQETLAASGYKAELWVRDGGSLGGRPEGAALVCTWPGEFQEALVEALALEGPKGLRLVIDAQFTRAPNDSPLARWAEVVGVPYVPGSRWWREQARLQDEVWFGPSRLGKARASALALVPASKSETLRALAIAAAFGLPTEIHGPALNDDTEVFVGALEKLGVSVDRDGSLWRVFSPREMRPPPEAIDMGEGATGMRILGALSVLMEGGPLRLTGAKRLLERPQEDLLTALGARAVMDGDTGGALEIPCGASLPGAISLERSSQFATAFLIAAAAELRKGKRERYELALGGEMRSLPYVRLTLLMLREAGIAYELGERSVTLFLAEKKPRLVFQIEKDASSLAFLEVYAKRWALTSFFEGMSRQGDSIFPELLAKLPTQTSVSLRHYPDLAPPLWAAAALFRLPLEVTDCPQLQWKESNRARLLVEAAQAMGARGELRSDGFFVDFSEAKGVPKETFLRTEGDHRLSMAAGVLSTDNTNLSPDRRDCVRKSFPHFWQVLALLEEAQPG
jgi:3-phosphoshikimate 1-carboxyvinyltransferase